MADKKISDLPELAQADSGDFIPIVDSSMNVTKRVAAEKVLPKNASKEVKLEAIDGGTTAGPLVSDGNGAVSVAPSGFYAGVHTFANSTGTQTITGPDFQVKGMIVMTAGEDSNTGFVSKHGYAFDVGGQIIQGGSAGVSAGNGGAVTSSDNRAFVRVNSSNTTIVVGEVTAFNPNGSISVNLTVASSVGRTFAIMCFG